MSPGFKAEMDRRAMQIAAAPSSPTPASPALASLGGFPAPPEMAADLRLLAELPEVAQRRLWEALGPAIREPLPRPSSST